ncbi:MAG: tetratricopeptide repeat protein [Alphaproteobacteria bacterium]|nr:MAG: tetratricopeptide repeat protein [Alphaproteobacteria bacterium]
MAARSPRRRRLAALGAALALAACQSTGGARVAEAPPPDAIGAPPPVAPGAAETVDGLTVGHRFMAAGEYELALEAYTRAAAEQGLTADVLSAMGSANLQLGRLGQAERLLRAAVERDPDFAAAWNNLGVVLMERGRAAEAVRVFRIAFSLDQGRSEPIRENLKRALAKRDSKRYDAPNDNNNDFALVRRGRDHYLLLSTAGARGNGQ